MLIVHLEHIHSSSLHGPGQGALGTSQPRPLLNFSGWAGLGPTICRPEPGLKKILNTSSLGRGWALCEQVGSGLDLIKILIQKPYILLLHSTYRIHMLQMHVFGMNGTCCIDLMTPYVHLEVNLWGQGWKQPVPNVYFRHIYRGNEAMMNHQLITLCPCQWTFYCLGLPSKSCLL